MKKILVISIGILVPALAAAHPSVMPHEHPHGVSLLPDLGALLLAAFVIGVAMIVMRLRKGMK